MQVAFGGAEHTRCSTLMRQHVMSRRVIHTSVHSSSSSQSRVSIRYTPLPRAQAGVASVRGRCRCPWAVPDGRDARMDGWILHYDGEDDLWLFVKSAALRTRGSPHSHRRRARSKKCPTRRPLGGPPPRLNTGRKEYQVGCVLE